MRFVLTAKPLQPTKRPIQVCPKVSIQPKPIITAVPISRPAAPLQTKIIIQPLQATVLPVVKPQPVTIQPAPSTGNKENIHLILNLFYFSSEMHNSRSHYV